MHAHPEPSSFTAALRDRAVTSLQSLGHQVVVADLYAEGFTPAASRDDFQTTANPDRFHYQAEQLHAAHNDGFAEDLRREHKRLQDADALVLTFPLWWGGPPAMLKGWFDRVLAYGVAYQDGQRFESGWFGGRPAVMGVVTGGTQQRFSPGGTYGDIERVLWPVQHCTLRYLGMRAADPFVAYAAPRVEDEARQKYLTTWGDYVAAVVGPLTATPTGPPSAAETALSGPLEPTSDWTASR